MNQTPRKVGKLIRIRKVLSTNQFQWVLWMDCDAIFTNFSIHWRDQLQPNPSDALTLAKDHNYYNTGVMLVSNTDAALHLLSDMLQERFAIDRWIVGWKDQEALRRGALQTTAYRLYDSRGGAKQDEFLLSGHKKAKWENGDWILHQVNCKGVMCRSVFMPLLILSMRI